MSPNLIGRGPRIRVAGGGGGGTGEGWWVGSNFQGGGDLPVYANPVAVDDVFVIWAEALPTIESVYDGADPFAWGWGQWYCGGGAYRVEVTSVPTDVTPILRFTAATVNGFLIHKVAGGIANFPASTLAP
jgi:hypothetical protein